MENRRFRWDIFAVVAGIVALCVVAMVMTAQAVDPADSEPDPRTLQEKDKEGFIKTESGLRLKDDKVGTGAKAKNYSPIRVHYRGTFKDGTEFENSYKRGEPIQFTLGKGSVIKGWEEGILGMRVGGKRTLYIPSELAYGAKGKGSIPPDTDLRFEIELLEVKNLQ